MLYKADFMTDFDGTIEYEGKVIKPEDIHLNILDGLSFITGVIEDGATYLGYTAHATAR